MRIGGRRVVRDARGFANHTGSDVNAELYERDLDTDEPNTTEWPPPQERRGGRRCETDAIEEGPRARVERAMPREPSRRRREHKAAATAAFRASAWAVEAALSVASFPEARLGQTTRCRTVMIIRDNRRFLILA
ncbi:hypothetical protein WJ33_10800 [Burkholderia ubonensis]|uniref:Uncharacterized protein n=1 Tax=Burkholderia ubonensis TaxID=101571 RepID=A0A103QML1_9BURK|nr:hypothetical protein [Burkholderia ubonensis]KVG52151.1 hypothetical protein WJ33_10800 [Burkholderia ubonensis]